MVNMLGLELVISDAKARKEITYNNIVSVERKPREL